MSSQEASPSRPNAEMCAAFLCAEAGISPVVLENQTAYVQGWLGKLRGGDKRMVVTAAGQAQRAAEYILNVRGDGDDAAKP
ncbi:MAG: zincin-like metallopeptidase domain-containing protein [Capsulimonadaceae bacterium]